MSSPLSPAPVEEIRLSDDEESMDVDDAGQGASAIITNEKPLNLDLIMPSFLHPTNSQQKRPVATVAPHVNKRLLEKQARTQHALRIKSRTDVPYTKTILPLSSSKSNVSPASPASGKSDDSEPKVLPISRPPQLLKPNLMRLPDVEATLRSLRSTDAPSSPTVSTSNYLFEAEPKVSVQEQQLQADDSNQGPFIFRCQYGKCRRKIYGNVSFINHIWAHATAYKPSGVPKTISVGGRVQYLANRNGKRVNGRSNIEKMCVCPHCFTQYRSPFLMQVHITRAHSSRKQALAPYTCEICEREVPKLGLHVEKLHEPRDMPYTCRKCRYKASTRVHLIRHIIAQHSDTNHLVCPLCSEVFTGRESTRGLRRGIAQSEQEKRILFAPEFINHMIMHESGARYGCDRCAQSFVTNTARMEHRTKEHNGTSAIRYTVRAVEKDRGKPIGQLVPPPELDAEAAMCGECEPMQEGGAQRKPCVRCAAAYITQSRGFKRARQSLSGARLGVDSTHTFSPRCVCGCGFTTFQANIMAEHAAVCGDQITVLPLADVKELPALSEEQRTVEESMFAVHRKISHEPDPEQEAKLAQLKERAEPNPYEKFLTNTAYTQEELDAALLDFVKANEERVAEFLKLFKELEEKEAFS